MTRYRVNGPRFVDETIDGEALVMDMVKGAYYTCLGPAAVAWNALKGGLEPGEVAALLTSRYQIASADADTDVAAFVAELVREEMLVVREGSSSGGTRTHGDGDTAAPGPYEALTFERYTDLADLILLDPVHDVSDAGWTHEPP